MRTGNMTRKKTPVAPIVPATPTQRRREVSAPSWYRKDYTFGSPGRRTMRQVVTDDGWVLPPFQRELVWTPDQQVAFCNSVYQGLPTAMILVWRRYIDGKNVRLVLDGQQRLAAVGAKVLRADGTPNVGTHAYFDLVEGQFSTDPGRWALTMADIAGVRFVEHLQMSDTLEQTGDLAGHDLWNGRVYANDVVSSRELTFFEIEERARPEYVVEAFRAINRPGTPFDQAEVERLVQAASDFK